MMKKFGLFRCLTAAICLWMLGAQIADAQTINVNVSGGMKFNRGIFGQALNSGPDISDGYEKAYYENLALEKNTSARGVAGGMYADSYDWRSNLTAWGPLKLPDGGTATGPSTLQILRNARDNNSSLIFTINQRGLGHFDKEKKEVVYTDTSTPMLASLAADWVRYTNHIVQNYRQGQESQMSADDQRILNAISWSYPDFSGDKLLKPGENPVPKVSYWEIGNEVNYYDNPEIYRARYRAIVMAMRQVDPTIKVGPNITGGYQGGAATAGTFLHELLRNGGSKSKPDWERVDFVSYHPYGYQILKVADTDHEEIGRQLNDIRNNQMGELTWVKNHITKAGRNPNSIELLATEWNPSTYNETWRLRQWNALGIVETAMFFARERLTAANFWLWPALINTGAKLPQYHAFEALTKYGGDTLVKSYSTAQLRLYVTRDSKTGVVAVWGMNFAFGEKTDKPQTLNVSLTNLGIKRTKITLMRLASLVGPTTLLSQESTDPKHQTIGWTTTHLDDVNLADFKFTLNPAELSVLVIQPAAAATSQPAAAQD